MRLDKLTGIIRSTMSSDDLWNRGSCKEDNFKRILVADFLSYKDFDILFLSLHLFLILCQKDTNYTCIDFLRCKAVYFFTSSLQYSLWKITNVDTIFIQTCRIVCI